MVHKMLCIYLDENRAEVMEIDTFSLWMSERFDQNVITAKMLAFIANDYDVDTLDFFIRKSYDIYKIKLASADEIKSATVQTYYPKHKKPYFSSENKYAVDLTVIEFDDLYKRFP